MCSIEERERIYDQFWKLKSLDEQRQYIIARMETNIPKQRTTKDESRRKQTSEYFLNKLNNERVHVCPNVFHGKTLIRDLVNQMKGARKQSENTS